MYFTQSGINETFMSPKMQKCVQNILITQILLKFHFMGKLFGCLGKFILWNLFWYKIHIFNISCIISLFFITVPVLESGARVPVQEFFFWKCSSYRTCTEQELSFKIIATFPRCHAKSVNASFVNITFCCLFFFSRGLTRPVKE